MELKFGKTHDGVRAPEAEAGHSQQSLEVGDVLKALAGMGFVNSQGVEVYKEGDVGVVRSFFKQDGTGHKRVKIAWLCTGMTTTDLVEKVTSRFKVLRKGDVQANTKKKAEATIAFTLDKEKALPIFVALPPPAPLKEILIEEVPMQGVPELPGETLAEQVSAQAPKNQMHFDEKALETQLLAEGCIEKHLKNNVLEESFDEKMDTLDPVLQVEQKNPARDELHNGAQPVELVERHDRQEASGLALDRNLESVDSLQNNLSPVDAVASLEDIGSTHTAVDTEVEFSNYAAECEENSIDKGATAENDVVADRQALAASQIEFEVADKEGEGQTQKNRCRDLTAGAVQKIYELCSELPRAMGAEKVSEPVSRPNLSDDVRQESDPQVLGATPGEIQMQVAAPTTGAFVEEDNLNMTASPRSDWPAARMTEIRDSSFSEDVVGVAESEEQSWPLVPMKLLDEASTLYESLAAEASTWFLLPSVGTWIMVRSTEKAGQ